MKLLASFLFPVLIFLMIGCSGYERTLKSTDYRKKYKFAVDYYNEGDYVRAATLFDQCAPVFRGLPEADTVYFYQAMSYFNQDNFLLAGHYFQSFSRTYGGSPFVEESDFMEAYCYYMTSPRPSLDQTSTMQAIQGFQLYLIKHPESARAQDCKDYIAELRNKLVEKSYMSAKLYFDLEDYKASLTALNNSIMEYPESKYREDILYMIVKSSYLLAFNSVAAKKKERFQDAVDDYYSFIAEYPDSKYNREARRYYRLAAKTLGNDIEEETEVELDN